MMRFSRFIIVVFFLLLPAQIAIAFDLKVESFTLKNGMKFVLIPDPQSPAVMHSLWYRVGSADEVAGKTGLAHFLEHLMYRGTPLYGPGEYFGQIDREGAEINAFTTRDYTVYHVRSHKDLLPLIMKLEADRMQNLDIDPGLMETERGVVKEERREKLDTNSSALLNEAMDATLYKQHPYGQPVVGYMDDVNTVTEKDAEDFYRRFYHPNNVVAIISGPLELDELKALAEEYYADVPRGDKLPARQIASMPELSKRDLVEIVNPAARTDMVLRSYIVPSFSSVGGNEALAVDFLSAILASGTQGRLVKALVLDQGIAADISVGYNGYLRHSGEFKIQGIPAAGVPPQKVAEAMDKVISDIIANGVTDAEIKRALKRARASRAYAFDRQTTLVDLVGVGEMTGWDGRNALNFDLWEGITAADVQAVARKYLRPENSVTGYLLREKRP